MSSLSAIGNSSIANSLIAGAPKVSGLASGLDTNKIITALLSVQQARISNLQRIQQRSIDQHTAFKAVEARLLAVQADAGSLARPQNGAFDVRVATSSDNSLLTAAAGSSAVAGSYTLHVNTLATAHQIASQGFDSAAAAINQGSYQVGSGASAATITIDASNNTLQGLATAINNANVGVTASIINDGSGTANHPFRLVLTAAKTGLTNAITFSGGGVGAPAFDTTLEEAADASVTLGSGSGAITVHSASNQLNNLIAGVSVNLLDADPSQAITLSIANDTANARGAIQKFVQDFNDLMGFIDDQIRFDPATGQAGILLGNFQITQLQDQLRNVLGGLVNTGNANMSHIGDLGITFDNHGHLDLDQDKLASALNGGQSGVSLDSIRSLFALTAKSTNPGVQFVTGSTKTKSSAVPYQVNITQAAQQAALTATNALADSTIVDNTNNNFAVAVDGIHSGPITLAAGTYTKDALAQQLQDQINAKSTLGGRQVTVAVVDGTLTITSNSYGTSSTLAIDGGSALTALGLDGSETAVGQNVAGNFIVNGNVEAATGSGLLLTGNSDNANTAGLQINVALTPTQVGAGTQVDLTVTRGLASMLNVTLNRFLDPVNGRLKSISEGFQTIEDNLTQDIARQAAIMQSQQESLELRFTAMEKSISQLQSIGNYLTMQFANLMQRSEK